MKMSKEMNEQQAILFTAAILIKKDLLNKLTCQLSTLFKENRRATETEYTRKNKIKRKGNRHIYGYIPFVIRHGKAYYQNSSLSNWIVSTLIPKLEAK